ncbi:MAG: hypothetical protein LT102_13595 [Burkholderiaceae bacterium]|nr:hypothetical protein [Burkholderiaceae bacterium]
MRSVPGRLFLVSILLGLVGCASIGAPTAEERTALAASGNAIVLLRVQCTIEDRQPYEPFRHVVGDDNISLGLGSFETGGEPERLASRFLSPQSRNDGWTFLVLAPGTYYLAFYPPRRTDVFTYARGIKDAPRWRIDVPPDARIAYVGTMRLSGASDRLLFGGSILRSIRADEMSVANEEELARALVKAQLPGAGELRTVLMKLQEGPTILHAPLPAR